MHGFPINQISCLLSSLNIHVDRNNLFGTLLIESNGESSAYATRCSCHNNNFFFQIQIYISFYFFILYKLSEVFFLNDLIFGLHYSECALPNLDLKLELAQQRLNRIHHYRDELEVRLNLLAPPH